MKLLPSLACIILLPFNSVVKAQPPTIALTQVISGLSSPLQLVNAGDGTKRIFIVEKDGSVVVYNKDYNLIGTFLSINVATAGEQGLLSMAFHPDYENNGFFYVFYDNSNGDLELARYHVSANPNVADAQSGVLLITIPHPSYTNHNGGELHFGRDGYLYLSTRDGGHAGDPNNLAQNTSVLLGKILRFNVNTTNIPPYYSNPASNPFGNQVFAYGLRNPFRWSFDRVTGDMWIGDVGQDSWEEINFRPADSTRKVNYGWRCYEGDADYDLSIGCAGPRTDYTFPLYTYPTISPAAITGGTVYRGNTYLRLRGYYLAVDFYSGTCYKIKYDSLTHTATTTTQAIAPTNISDFGETEEGELFAVAYSGTVHRISSDGPTGYTFTGNGNWNVASNWSNNAIPPPSLPSGAEIFIDPVEAGECVLNIPQVVQTGAKLTVQAGKKFQVNGNLVIQ